MKNLNRVLRIFTIITMLFIVIPALIIDEQRNKETLIRLHSLEETLIFQQEAIIELSQARFTGSRLGVVTYYGQPFHLRKTAYGEVYDMYGFTCASNTLPYNTWVLFTNPKNGRRCLARVTDTGDFTKLGVDFDVSFGVAERLRILEDGKLTVEYRVMEGVN